MEKSCKTCMHFYTCDNMGAYEDCLPEMTEYEPYDDECEDDKDE